MDLDIEAYQSYGNHLGTSFGSCLFFEFQEGVWPVFYSPCEVAPTEEVHQNPRDLEYVQKEILEDEKRGGTGIQEEEEEGAHEEENETHEEEEGAHEEEEGAQEEEEGAHEEEEGAHQKEMEGGEVPESVRGLGVGTWGETPASSDGEWVPRKRKTTKRRQRRPRMYWSEMMTDLLKVAVLHLQCTMRKVTPRAVRDTMIGINREYGEKVTRLQVKARLRVLRYHGELHD